MVVLALFTVGLFSRVTAVLAWVIVVSTVRRAPVTVFGFDQIVSTLDALPGDDGGERPGGLARPVLRPAARGRGRGGTAAARRPLGRPAGARGDRCRPTWRSG